MATVPLIFPSLSRQPSMDSSRSFEDDTIRDQMESGYVATRPRFTRARRTWKVNVRNLQAEDVRALDRFVMTTAARGGNAFLYPNLLPNGSFEFSPCTATELVSGWTLTDNPTSALTVSVSGAAEDGTAAILFQTVAGQALGAGVYQIQDLQSTASTPCTAGEVYVFRARANCTPGTLANRGDLMYQATVTTYDANGTATFLTAGLTLANVSTAGWQDYTATFTVPTGAVTLGFGFRVVLGDSSVPLSLDGSASVVLDEVGCTLLTPLTPYGRMAGSQPLGCLVRFSKLPEVSDIGFGAGVKRYGANFELTEV